MNVTTNLTFVPRTHPHVSIQKEVSCVIATLVTLAMELCVTVSLRMHIMHCRFLYQAPSYMFHDNDLLQNIVDEEI